MEKKWFNIKAHDVLRLAGENVAINKAAAGAEAANEMHADSSAESNAVFKTGYKESSSPGSNARLAGSSNSTIAL